MLKAQATVATPKAARYLKALCNHFDKKVSAEYDDNQGTVRFGFAYCEMQARDAALVIAIEAENADNFDRVKYVVSDHLVRFGASENLEIVWINQN